MKKLLSLALAVLRGGIGVATTANPPSEESRLSWSDQGDGTHRNPILPAENLASARNTPTEELWGDAGAMDTKLASVA